MRINIIVYMLRESFHYLIILAFVLFGGCQGQTGSSDKSASGNKSSSGIIEDHQGDLLHRLNDALSMAVIQDGHKPPVASRIYAYANIAAYEGIVERKHNFKSFEGQLNAFNGLPDTKPEKEYDYRVSMIQAFTDVGRELIYRKYILDSTRAMLLDTLRPYLNQEVYERSINYGKKLASAITQWAKTDGYQKIQNMPNYTVADSASAWQPTPPTYGEACEPHWYKIRLFVLDSIQQFNPPPPTPFSKEKGSAFYQQAMEVYNFSKDVSKEQREIAWFWNDRPSNNQVQGHMMTTKRQISPPGHWVNITQIACEKKDLSLIRSAEAYAMVGIAFADAFKTNWYTKYHYNLIRPVTYINRYIDSSWSPLLETPMFPEYTSAHSTMSGASAVVLSTLIDSSMSFVDSTEAKYGYTVREFDSFYDAAWEVTMSRVYGGIHYREACEIGTKTGLKIGRHIISEVDTRKEEDLVARIPEFPGYSIEESIEETSNTSSSSTSKASRKP